MAFPPIPRGPHVVGPNDQWEGSHDGFGMSHDRSGTVVQANCTRPQIPTVPGQQQQRVRLLSQKRKREDDCGGERGKGGGKKGRYGMNGEESLKKMTDDEEESLGIEKDAAEDKVEKVEDRECVAAIMPKNTKENRRPTEEPDGLQI